MAKQQKSKRGDRAANESRTRENKTRRAARIQRRKRSDAKDNPYSPDHRGGSRVTKPRDGRNQRLHDAGSVQPVSRFSTVYVTVTLGGVKLWRVPFNPAEPDHRKQFTHIIGGLVGA